MAGRRIAPVTHSDPQVVRDREGLARRIVRERERLGVKQKHLAWRAGVAAETVSRIECGRVSAAPESLEKIERALAELAAGADPRAKPPTTPPAPGRPPKRRVA